MSVVQISDLNDAEKRFVYKVDLDSGPLGSGGMGKVYRGELVDKKTGITREVAVKFLYDNQPQGVIDRARREASIHLRNDNLVEMIAFVEEDQPGPQGTVRRYHVVSELLHGVMLLDLITKRRTSDAEGNEVPYAKELLSIFDRDREEFAILIAKNVLNGLMALHNAGYIHRDLDPSNIMITADRKIKIIDFGIAKSVTSLSSTDTHLTNMGQFMGKAAYAAPELISGDLPNQNNTTDIYAVGIILYVLIVGELPFSGSLPEIMSMQLTKPIPLNKINNKKIRKIISKATQKQRSKRYQSAANFIVALEKQPNQSKFVWTEKYTQIVIWTAAIIGGLAVGFSIANLLS